MIVAGISTSLLTRDAATLSSLSAAFDDVSVLKIQNIHKKHEIINKAPSANSFNIAVLLQEISQFKPEMPKYYNVKILRVEHPILPDPSKMTVIPSPSISFGMNAADAALTLDPESPLFAIHHILDYLSGLKDIAKAKKEEEALGSMPHVIANCKGLRATMLEGFASTCILQNVPFYKIMTAVEIVDHAKRCAEKGIISTESKKPEKMGESDLKTFVYAQMNLPDVAETVCAVIAAWVEHSTPRILHMGDTVKFKHAAKAIGPLCVNSIVNIDQFSAGCMIQPLVIERDKGHRKTQIPVKCNPYFSYRSHEQVKVIDSDLFYSISMEQRMFSQCFDNIGQIQTRIRDQVISGDVASYTEGIKSVQMVLPLTPKADLTKWFGETDSCVLYYAVASDEESNGEQWCCGQTATDKKICLRAPILGYDWLGTLYERVNDKHRVDTRHLRNLYIANPLWSEHLGLLGFGMKDVDLWKGLGPVIVPHIGALLTGKVNDKKSSDLQATRNKVWETNGAQNAAKASFLKAFEVEPGVYEFSNQEDLAVGMRHILNGPPASCLHLDTKNVSLDTQNMYRRIGIPISREKAEWIIEKQRLANSLCIGSIASRPQILNLSSGGADAVNIKGVDSDFFDFVFVSDSILSLPNAHLLRHLSTADTDHLFTDAYAALGSGSKDRTKYLLSRGIEDGHALQKLEIQIKKGWLGRMIIFAIKKERTGKERVEALAELASMLSSHMPIVVEPVLEINERKREREEDYNESDAKHILGEEKRIKPMVDIDFDDDDDDDDDENI